MITAVDTNVLIDVFANDAKFMHRSRNLLRRCAAEGALVACSVVWAEVGAQFSSSNEAAAALATMGVTYSSLQEGAAANSARAWHSYRTRGGPRTRVVADFLIGAHAEYQADRLLTRDRGFYRSYFSRLTVLDPAVAA